MRKSIHLVTFMFTLSLVRGEASAQPSERKIVQKMDLASMSIEDLMEELDTSMIRRSVYAKIVWRF
jgi:hypothetical protein